MTGETAIFDTKTNLITMLGGVVLTQGKNVLRGDRLMVDMTTGVSRVESDSGRVQGLFIQGRIAGPAGRRDAGAAGRAVADPGKTIMHINALKINWRHRTVEAGGASLYLPEQGARRGVSLGRGHPFIHGSPAKRFAGGCVAESP